MASTEITNSASLPTPMQLGLCARQAAQPVIGVKRKHWRQDDEHASQADAAFAAVRKAVLARDQYTCRFCGFQASKYQEVHHIDDNHANNDESNLLTVCNLCHQVHHLGMFAMRNAGFLAALPELTQVEVNHLCRLIHGASLIATAPVVERLQGLFAVFKSRGADTLKKAFGSDISDPYLLTQILSGGDDELYASRAIVLEDLRLVSSANAFRAGQLEFYAKTCSQYFQPNTWSSLSKELFEVHA